MAKDSSGIWPQVSNLQLGRLPLHWVIVMHASIEVVDLLLELTQEEIQKRGEKEDNIITDKDGRTPFDWAIIKNNEHLIEYLISEGANREINWLEPNYKSRHGDTALHIAAQ